MIRACNIVIPWAVIVATLGAIQFSMLTFGLGWAIAGAVWTFKGYVEWERS